MPTSHTPRLVRSQSNLRHLTGRSRDSVVRPMVDTRVLLKRHERSLNASETHHRYAVDNESIHRDPFHLKRAESLLTQFYGQADAHHLAVNRIF
jgi:hypothetical protein